MTTLSDSELNRIGRGGVSVPPNGQSLPQDTKQPHQNDPIPLSLDPPDKKDGMDHFPQTMAVLQSTVTLDYRRNLVLGGIVQRDLVALNLENEYSSDVIATTNIIGGRLFLPAGITPKLVFSQTSELNQLHRHHGSLYSSNAGYRHETTVRARTGTEDHRHHTNLHIDQRDRSESYHRTASSWDVEVGTVSLPEITTGTASLHLIEPFELVFIHGFEFGGTVETLVGEFGGEVSYSGLTLKGPTASFDGLERARDDLLINATLTLPALDAGDIGFKACVAFCTEGTVDLGSIGGTNLFEVLAAIDAAVAAPSDAIGFSDSGIVLKGAGALLEDELNLNTGFAFVGNGHFRSERVASVKIGGELSFGLEAELNFTVDLSSIKPEGLIKAILRGQDVFEFSKNFNIIDVTIPITFFETEIQPFDIEFDGVVLVQLGSGEVSADELAFASADYFFRDNSRFEESFSEDISESTFNETVTHTVFIGGQITAAEAELLALSEGTLAVNKSGNVSLSNSAQRNMTVMHAVNAVSSVAANSFNIGQMPSSIQGTGRQSQISLHQQNRFVQHR